MKILSIGILTLLLSLAVEAQTKLISFKSHSGKIKHFKMAVRNDPNLKRSDFGNPEKIWRIDTAVFVQKKGLVLVTIYGGGVNSTFNRKYFKLDTIWQQAPNLPSPSKDSIIARIRAKYYDLFYSLDLTFKGFDPIKSNKKK